MPYDWWKGGCVRVLSLSLVLCLTAGFVMLVPNSNIWAQTAQQQTNTNATNNTSNQTNTANTNTANNTSGNATSNNGATTGSCGWNDFLMALGEQESSNNYGIRNPWDYVGRFQLGEGALNSIGWYQDNSLACGQKKRTCNSSNCEGGFKTSGGTTICINDWTGNFSGNALKYNITTITDYLNSKEAQDAAASDWFNDIYKKTSSCHNKIGQQACGCTVTMSGIIAAGHLGGPHGGCLAVNGSSTGDGGSSTCKYLCKFADYEVPAEITRDGRSFSSSGNCKGCVKQCNPVNNPSQQPTSGSGTTSTGAGSVGPGIIITHSGKFDDQAEALKKIWVATLQMMTSQLTAAMMDQVTAVGMLFDAKHQLEVQREFQRLTAQAHKDYHPSAQMCVVGTFVRSLTESERYSDLTQIALSERMLDRETISGDVLTLEGSTSDYRSRLDHFIEKSCNEKDAGKGPDGNYGLSNLCKNGNKDAKRKDMDVDYTTQISAPLTIDIDFVKGGEPTAAEEDIMALLNNLFYNDPFPEIEPSKTQLKGMSQPLQNMRSIIAMRGIAQNSIANIVAEKTASPDAASAMPFIRALIKEFGLDQTEIDKLFGENPSYYAQMEILTKTLYQHPHFVMNLYDKPTNVKRIRAAMRAIKLMQDRDINEAMLRREMLLSMILEIRIREYQAEVLDSIRGQLGTGRGPVNRPNNNPAN